MFKNLVYFLRRGQWPKTMRYGVPRTEYGCTVTTYRASNPFWWKNGEGGRTLFLDDGSQITVN